jgi:hypothetical protein
LTALSPSSSQSSLNPANGSNLHPAQTSPSYCGTSSTASLNISSPNPAAGPDGTNLTLVGNGFYGPGQSGYVQIWLESASGTYLDSLAFVSAGTAEPFNVTVYFPYNGVDGALALGTYYLWGLNDTSPANCADAPFTLTGVNPGLACESWSSELSVISPTPAVGGAGTSVILQGVGFYDDNATYIYWAAADGSSLTYLVTVNSSATGGWFNITADVPTGFTPGTYFFWGTDGTSDYDCAGAEFILAASNASTLTLNPSAGAPGILVTANGSGLATSVTVSFTFDGTAVASTCSTSGTGIFPGTTGTPCSFTVPTAASGDDGGLNVVATAGGSSQAYASFTGTAFSPNPDTADLTFDGTLMTPNLTNSECNVKSELITLNSTGGFVCTFTVPTWAMFGTNDIQGYDTSSTELTTVQTFTVWPQLTITSTQTVGLAGTPVTATGSGWSPGDSIALWVAVVTDTSAYTTLECVGAPGGEPVVGSTGGFVCNFDFPIDGPGVYDVVATDATDVTYPPTVIYSTNTFQLEVPILNLLPAEGPVGTVVTVAGSLFPSGGFFYYCFEGSGTPTPCGTSRAFIATAGGDIPFGTAILVPSSGNAQLVVSDTTTGAIAFGAFTVTTPFTGTVSPSTGQAGPTSISVGGLADSTSYWVYLDTVQGVASAASYDPLGTCVSSSTGTITACTVDIPTGLTTGKYFLDLFQDPTPPPYIYTVYNFTLAPSSPTGSSHSTGLPSSVLGLPLLEFLVLVLAAIVVVILAVVAVRHQRRKGPPPAPAPSPSPGQKGPTGPQ